jgi:hypothetical protein
MNNAQAKRIQKIQSRTSTAEVEEKGGCVFVRWNNGKDGWASKYNYMAVIGKRGGIKVISTHGGLCDDKKHAKIRASLALFDLNMRGTIALIG